MALYANLAGVEVGDDFPVRIVGVLNVSPESFYAGSVRRGRRQLQREAERMLADGADILDLGAMSTAPYRRTQISAAEEEERLRVAIEAVREVSTVPLSADTRRSGVAAAALRAGAAILNDVSGLAGDEAMGSVARDAGGVVLMACPEEARAAEPIPEIARLLRRCLARARAARLPREHVALDPGVGFFRHGTLPWYAIDCLILRDLRRFRRLGHPLLVGASRKSFLGHVTGRARPEDRLHASLAAAALAVLNGAALVRTHDVGPTRDSVRVAEAVRNADAARGTGMQGPAPGASTPKAAPVSPAGERRRTSGAARRRRPALTTRVTGA